MKILFAEGDAVAAGDEVVILASMKMEIPVEAESTGAVEGHPLIDIASA